MKKILIAVFGILICSQYVLAANLTEQQNKDLHEVSNNIESSVDYKTLIEGYFPDFVKRVFINNKQLSQKEIDEKVKAYLKEQYLPRLVFNYGVLYGKLMSAGKDFTPLDKPEAILPGFKGDRDENTPHMSEELVSELSLSAGIDGQKVVVYYRAKAYNDEYWHDPYVEYGFEYREGKLILVDIKQKHNIHIKQFIDGV